MADKIVKINSDASIHYFPPGSVVHHGDKVTFTLMCNTCTGTVTFDSASCLDVPGPIALDGSSPATAEKTHTVTATSGKFPFTAQVNNGSEVRHIGLEGEAKRGELDVTTEPPPPEEDEKR